MSWSKSSLPLSVTNFSRTVLSASGDPVNNPVLIEFFSFTVAARASPAASHASGEATLIAQAQAADGFFAPLGIASAEPPAMPIVLPELSRSGVAAT